MGVQDSQGPVGNIRFTGELRRQFEALEDNAGRRTGRRLVIVAIGVAVAAAIIGSLAFVLAGSSSAPEATQMLAMQSSITSYLTARSQGLAPQDVAYQSNLPNVAQSVYDKANAQFHEAVAKVGSPEFVEREAHANMGFALAGMRKNGDVMVSSQARVLGLDYVRTLDNGDVVVWAKLWLGDIRRHFASGEVGVGPAATQYVDETPTYQYQMRNIDGQRKIVSEALVFESEDAAATADQFGPDTPHETSSRALVSGNEGLVLDTPSPQSS